MSSSDPIGAEFSDAGIPKAAKEQAHTGRRTASRRSAAESKNNGARKGKGTLSRGRHQPSSGVASPAKLVSASVMTNNQRSIAPKNFKAATASDGWIQTKKNGAGAAVDDRREGTSLQQAQNVLALGVPAERRASQPAVTNNPERATIGETRAVTQALLLPRQEGSGEDDEIEEDTGTELEEEDDEVGVGGANKLELMDTQELLANEDISQLERLHSQQQREADRHIKRLVKKALPDRRTAVLTPGEFIGGAGVRKRRIARCGQLL